MTWTGSAGRVRWLAALALGIALGACSNNAGSPAKTGGSGGAEATGGTSGTAGNTGGTSSTGTGGASNTGTGGASSTGTGGTSSTGTGGTSATGTGGTSSTGTGGTSSTGTGGGAAGGASGSGAAGNSGMVGGSAGQGRGGRSGGSGAGGSATGGIATGGMAGMASGGASGAPAGGSGGASACKKGTTKGNDVLLIGDSFIALSRDIPKDLVALARAAGALAASDTYRDKSVSGTQLSGGISPEIPKQYADAQKQAPVKVVIMDGGGNDMGNNTCSDPPTASCPAIQSAVTAVKDLFVQMGKDSVESVVFFFYPENQKNATQRAKIDVLRALLQDVCTSAVSPKCYGVDLRPVFVGHFTEYVLSDGVHPTAAGSQATAEAIWSVMQDNCIAQ